MNDVMVCNAKHFDARVREPLLCGTQFVLCFQFEREVIDPSRRVRRWLRLHIIAEIEKCDVRAVAHLEKHVNVWAKFAGRWYVVQLDEMRERQTQHILIEMPGLFRVAATICEMMQALDLHRRLRSWLKLIDLADPDLKPRR